MATVDNNTVNALNRDALADGLDACDEFIDKLILDWERLPECFERLGDRRLG